MARSASHGLQHWLESRAAGPAFLIAAVCVMARGATFWSGGAFTVAGLLGAGGLRWFNGVTGIGIAVGAELLTSVFGRQWLRAEAEKHEAAGRSGLRRTERDALCAAYAFQARISKGFMGVGIAASTAAAFMFLATSTGAGNGWAILGELVIAAVLVVIMTGFGVFYQDRPDSDAGELATGQARGIRSRIVEAAGGRIAHGTFTAQDVRIVARALPRTEREKFEAALLTDSPDDPIWTVGQLAAWLGCDDSAGRRRITRRLSKLLDQGVGVVKDERTGYRIPQSVIAMYFSGEYLSAHKGAPPATLAGRSHQSGPLAATPGAVAAASETSAGLASADHAGVAIIAS